MVVYTTECYLKYLLTDGDKGLLKCLDKKMYVVCLKEDELSYVDLMDKTIERIKLDL